MVMSRERFFLCLVLLMDDEEPGCSIRSLSLSFSRSLSLSLSISLSDSKVLKHTSSTPPSSVFRHLVPIQPSGPSKLILHCSILPSKNRHRTDEAGMSNTTSSRMHGRKEALSSACWYFGMGNSSCIRLDRCVVQVWGSVRPSGKSSNVILNRTLGLGDAGKSLINIVELLATAGALEAW